MSFDLLGSWVRGLISVAIVVAGVLLIRRWADDLPRAVPVLEGSTGAVTQRPLPDLRSRLSAWEPRRDGGTGPLVGGVLLLLFAAGGRLASPWLWRRGGRAPRLAPPRTTAVRTRHGYTLHLEERGTPDAPRVLLVHGAGSDRTQWRETIEDLAEDRRVSAFDLLGHGRSSHVAGAEHTLAAAADDLDDVVRHLGGPDGLVLVGHSMGGMIAMSWVARDPKQARRLAGLVLTNTTPQDPFTTIAGSGFHRALERPVHRPLLRITPPLAPFVRLMDALQYLNGMAHWQAELTSFGGTETREQLDRVARLTAGMDPGAVARFTLSMMALDVRKDLEGFDVPTVVVVGSRDPVTRPEAGHLIARRVPGARLVTLQGTRHMGFMEQRRRFARAIRGVGREESHERENGAGARGHRRGARRAGTHEPRPSPRG